MEAKTLEELTASFRERLAPHVGKKVNVWRATPHRPYVSGELLRIADEGLVISGFGVQAYPEIDAIGVDGLTIKYATS